MTMRLVFSFLLISACGHSASESNAPGVKLDTALVSLEMLKDSSPKLYPLLKSLYVLGVQSSLGHLGFGPVMYSGEIDAETQAATRRYERARGLPITGNPFASTTYSRLTAEGERATRLAFRTRSGMIGQRHFSGWGDYFTGDGLWIAPGTENPAALKVECFRDRSECYVAEAEYGEQLTPVIDYFDILSWDSAEIRSKPVDSYCQRSVLTINRVEESVVIVRSTLRKEPSCNLMARDTSVAFNRTSHLATDAEADSVERQHASVLFDSLLNLTPALRRTLSSLRDTAALRAAAQSGSH